MQEWQTSICKDLNVYKQGYDKMWIQWNVWAWRCTGIQQEYNLNNLQIEIKCKSFQGKNLYFILSYLFIVTVIFLQFEPKKEKLRKFQTFRVYKTLRIKLCFTSFSNFVVKSVLVGFAFLINTSSAHNKHKVTSTVSKHLGIK